MQLKEAIQARQSIKKFSDRRADWRKIIHAIDSARYAPMAGNNFSLRFILVGDEKKIEQIKEATQQEFVKTPYLIVVVSDDEKVKQLYDERGKGYAKQQAGAAIQNVLLSLTDFGIDSCWVGHFYEEKIKNTLDISEKMSVEAVIPVGFRSKAYGHSKAKKTELDNVLFFDKWKNKKMSEEFRVSDMPKE
jgi:nitroreductase